MLFILTLVAMAVRFPLVSVGSPFYSSDTAILDLMAKHFMKGELSFYYWGEGYYGVLDQAFLVPLFKVFGYGPLVSQMVPFAFSISFLVLYHRFLAETAGPATALMATSVLAVGSPFFLTTTFTTYNYILGLNFGMAFLLMFKRIRQGSVSAGYAFLFGLVAGFSFYYFRLALLFWIAVFLSTAVSFVSHERFRRATAWIRSLSLARIWNEGVMLQGAALQPWLKRLLVFVNLANAGNLLVAAFLWVHGDWIGIVHGHTVKFFFSPVFASSLQLAGLVVLVHFWGPIVSWFQDFRRRFIPMSMVWGFLAGYWPALLGTVFGHSPSSTGKYESLPETLENLSVLFRDIFPWMFRAGALPALFPYVVLIYAGGIGALLFEIYAQYKKWRDGQALALHPFVYLFIINLLVALFSLRLGNQGTARYLLPLFISLPFGIALFLERTTGRAYAVALALLGVFLFANYAAGRELLTRTPRPASLSAVASCLEAHHYPGGYADYWLAYQITALSNERVILAPTGDNDRYKPYLAYVRSLKNVILLGETPQPLRSLVTVKGVPYRVIAADSCSGVPVMMMEKAT